jgi:pSer/pThr/pTyr-binding forkhead associated (FHA) protein
MKNLVDKVLQHAARLDTVVDAFVTDRLRGDRPLTPAELLGAVAADVERGITLGADGPIFPFNRISVSLAAATAERDAELRGALSADSVRSAIVAQLQRRVPVPSDLKVDLRVVLDSGATAPFTVTLRTAAVKRSAMPLTPPPSARLVAADGSARFTLGEGVFNIGRVAEIHGRDGRMIRRNQIVLGSDAAGGTVSRMHARIHGPRKDDTIVFTLFDDGSQRGSMVVRGGVPHTVVKGPVGVRLRDGDEVYFGKVKMSFRLR